MIGFNIQHKRSLSRRTVLKGLGVTLALPWLEAMEHTVLAKPPAAPKPPTRAAYLFFANGVYPSSWDIPGESGPLTSLSPTLQPLEKVKDQLIVFSELHNAKVNHGAHISRAAGFLTGAEIRKTRGSDIFNGISVDQVAAQSLGSATRLPSIELAIDDAADAVVAEKPYCATYGAHSSWKSATQPAAKEANPRLAFQRLFRSAQLGRDPLDQSVLDLVGEEAKRLSRQVGKRDQEKLGEYLDSVRALEKRMERFAANQEDERRWKPIVSEHDMQVPLVEDSPSFPEHVRLMLDVMVLAFQTDATRIGTFMFSDAARYRDFGFIDGVKAADHVVSHHKEKPEKVAQYKLINRWYMEQYAYLLENMAAIQEGDGTLLDHVMVLSGSCMKDGDKHAPENLPVLLAGGGSGQLKTGQHVKLASKTPLCNLHLSLLHLMGVKEKQFGNSTGLIGEILV